MKVYPVHLRGLGMTAPLSILGVFGVLGGIAADNVGTIGMAALLAIPGLLLTAGLLADLRHPEEYFERNEHVFGRWTRAVGVLGVVGIAAPVLLVPLSATDALALTQLSAGFGGVVTGVGTPVVVRGRAVLSAVPLSVYLGVAALSVVVMVLTKLVGGAGLSEEIGLLLRGDLDHREDPVFEV